MFAAQIIERRHGMPATDIVGVGETQQEALERLRDNWVLDCLHDDPTMGERRANALFDDIMNGDDAEWEISYSATA